MEPATHSRDKGVDNFRRAEILSMELGEAAAMASLDDPTGRQRAAE
jgi:hypothetical protein